MCPGSSSALADKDARYSHPRPLGDGEDQESYEDNHAAVRLKFFRIFLASLSVIFFRLFPSKDFYLILDTLPCEYDSRVKAMEEVDTRPTEQYSDIDWRSGQRNLSRLSYFP